jgi:amidase
MPTLAPTDTLVPTTTRNNTSTYTPTGTSQSTATITPTPIASPTVCPVQFLDVPSGSTFYYYVRCLACMGVVTGYADGSFHPNSSVTRGQLSKIVANAAGFNETETTLRYEDVPVGSTFQVYIGRLTSRGYISGYACGGPGEPCVPPGNLPYFHPTGKATRGQTGKIVSEAAGFQELPTGQTFEDVPPGSTFYPYIQRLASRGIMSGYQCGNPEPCVPPNNRPYFRSGSNVTRGQTTKIVANAFFPACHSAKLP